MKRKKRLTIIRVGLAMAALAIPAVAQAKPLPTDQSQHQQAGPSYRIDGVGGQTSVEVPYLSHGQGVDAAQFGGTPSPDDRSFSRMGTPAETGLEIPYLSHGQGVTPAELGIATSNSPDDRPFQRPTVEPTPVTTDGGWSIDVNPYAVSGFGLALLLVAGGMGLAIRQSRRGRLSPA